MNGAKFILSCLLCKLALLPCSTHSGIKFFHFYIYKDSLARLLVSRGKRSLDRISLDRNCHFSLDRNFTNHLIEFLDTFHLIESENNEFGQTPKNRSVDRIIRSTD